MLPKSRRLNLKKDFKWVASGKKLETKFATLFIKMGQNSFPKTGIAVSAGYFKKATQRNRARRVLSSVLEELYPKLPDNINIVALPKSKVLLVKSPEVLTDLEEKLNSEKIIH